MTILFETKHNDFTINEIVVTAVTDKTCTEIRSYFGKKKEMRRHLHSTWADCWTTRDEAEAHLVSRAKGQILNAERTIRRCREFLDTLQK